MPLSILLFICRDSINQGSHILITQFFRARAHHNGDIGTAVSGFIEQNQAISRLIRRSSLAAYNRSTHRKLGTP